MSPRRKYGATHRKIRRAMLPFAYGMACQHCGLPMKPGQDLHLDHSPDGLGYRGMVHAFCNMSEGGRRGAAARAPRGGVFPRRTT